MISGNKENRYSMDVPVPPAVLLCVFGTTMFSPGLTFLLPQCLFNCHGKFFTCLCIIER